jgi:hypothetical protein
MAIPFHPIQIPSRLHGDLRCGPPLDRRVWPSFEVPRRLSRRRVKPAIRYQLLHDELGPTLRASSTTTHRPHISPTAAAAARQQHRATAAPGSSLYGQLRSSRYGLDDSSISGGTNQIDIEIKISLRALDVATDGGHVDSLPLLQLQVGASPLVQCLAHCSLATSSASSYRQRKAHRMTISRQLYQFGSPLRV